MSQVEDHNDAPRALDMVAFLCDADSSDLVQSLIFDLELENVVVRQGSVDDALDFIKTLPSWPHQLLVDIAGSPQPLSDMKRVTGIAEPGTRIIVVGDRNDVGLFRDLMHLGVADYLVKPFTPAMLRGSLNLGAIVSPPPALPAPVKSSPWSARVAVPAPPPLPVALPGSWRTVFPAAPWSSTWMYITAR